MNKLKILFISSDKFPPFRVDVSILIGKEIVGRGHQVDWVLQSDKPCKKSYQTNWQDSIIYVGATDTGSSKFSRIKKHSMSIFNDFRIFSLVKKNKYDIILVKDKFVAAIFALVAARLYKTKFVYWISFPFPEASIYYAKHGLARYPILYLIRGYLNKWLLYKLLAPKSDYILVQSEQMLRDFVEEGIQAKQMSSIPMGVALEMFPDTDLSVDSSIVNSPKTVVYLGTLNQSRKMDFLVRAFALVNQEIPESILYMIGNGDHENDIPKLKEECERLNIASKVIFTGFQERQQALAYVNESNVCVSPFYPTPILNSTSPTKIVEYMAMGKAVVANDHPEQRLIIEQSEAGICTTYSEDKFAAAIIELLNNPEKAIAMGKKGRQFIKDNRSYESISHNVETLFYKITETE